MNKLRDEIFEIKENIYSSNIEKRKLSEKLYTLNEMSKKIDSGYNSYKELADKVDRIKSIKGVMEFKNINLKNRIPAKKSGTGKREMSNKEEGTPSSEFLAKKELKEDFNKLHYNDKTTLEDKKSYMMSECKELIAKSVSGTNITLFANLSEECKYEIETGSCETMIRAYSTGEELRANTKKEGNLVVIDLLKNSHYIPTMTLKGDYCALIGGDVTILYKEKINTGEETVDIWHIKK